MKPEEMAEKLKGIYGTELQSVVLYGSAAGPDFHHRHSDFNLMVVLNETSLSVLARSVDLCQKWMREGNPAPLFVTSSYLVSSFDVFPIEFFDMKERHRVLYGQDPLSSLTLSREFLRLQCESELKGKLIALRTEWIRLYPSKRKIKKFLLKSSSSFFALFRGLLRLMGESIPPTKREVLGRLQQRTTLSMTSFEIILEVLAGNKKLSRTEIMPLMEDYLTTVEKVATFVDTIDTKEKL
ncbi:MAG: hypothetical protein Q7S98_04200 [Deltaproteobacteria bacterium]|nr:hypothetical protein [Deltaproteobacteria bacterium]